MSEDQGSLVTSRAHCPDEAESGHENPAVGIPPTAGVSARPVAWQRSAHIYAVYGMSIVQTILLVLSNNPSFWVVRRSNGVDIAFFMVAVLVLIPALLIAVPYFLSRAHAMLGWALHLVILGALVILFLVDMYGNVFGDSSGIRIVVLSVVTAILVLIGYMRVQFIRDLLLAIAVAPAAIAVLFILNLPPLGANDVPPVSLGVVEDNPVVVLVLDELSLPVLKDADGELDSTRFPNFARLAAMSTWYPMASSVHDGTLSAVPAILTGNLPGDDALPIAARHPVNLFTALADTHEMVVYEKATRLCPDRLCASTRPERPVVDRVWTLLQDSSVVYLNSIVPHEFLEVLRIPGLGVRWGEFLTAENAVVLSDDSGPVERRLSELAAGERRAADIGRFIDDINDRGSALYFLHIDLPHAPYSMLPDGRWYRWPGSSAEVDDRGWTGDEWRRQQVLAKYSANVGYADFVVGELLDQLDRVGILDESLLVVVSDHGVSFKANEPRRLVTEGNFVELASVPLFVKLPHQEAASVDMRNAETIDVFSTVIDVLGGRVETDGSSLLGQTSRDTKRMGSREGPMISMGFDVFELRVAETQAELASFVRLGVGHEGLLSGIGPIPELFGRRVADLDVHGVSGEVSFVDADGTGALAVGATPPAVVVAEISTSVDELPSVFALVADGVVVSTATPVEITERSANVRFFVDYRSILAAGGVVEVMGVAEHGSGSYRLVRFG